MRLFEVFSLALERLWQQRVLALWATTGLGVAAMLAVGIVLYVDVVNTRLLSSSLDVTGYAFRHRYLGSWNGNVTVADVQSVNAVMCERFAPIVGLPVEREVWYARSSPWNTTRSATDGAAVPLGAFSFGALEGVHDQIEIVAGVWEREAASVSTDDAIPVLLAEAALYQTGVQVGDVLTAARPGGSVTLLVVGLWRARDADDPTWIFTPRFFDQVALMQQADFWRLIEPLEKPIEEAAWFTVFDGSALRTSDVQALLNRAADAQVVISSALAGIRLDLAPIENLQAFNAQVAQLTRQLALMVLPIALLILYFVSLVAALLTTRQQAEDVVLSSRGMSRWGILGIHARLWLLIAGTGLILGLLCAPLLVWLVSRTTAFLRFDGDAPLLLPAFTGQSLMAGALASLTAASAGLWNAWDASRRSIIQSGRRAARAWWQRIYLDVILLIPAGYALYTLAQSGGLVASSDDPFSDPLVFLSPTLFSLATTLLFIRLWHIFAHAASRIVSASRSMALLMALRELTRSVGRYRGILFMMGFTLSLSGFTASLASTLDRSLQDSVDYQIGADAVAVVVAEAQAEQTSGANGQPTLNVTGFNTLPVNDLQRIDGVEHVSRVGRYAAQLTLTGQRLDGTVLGIDRAAIAAVVRARPDYADVPYADLFNRLAGNRTGALLSTWTARQHDLRIGQEITLQVSALNEWYELRMPIVGLVDYFPTLDPRTGFFVLTSLDPIFEAIGSELPHDFWLSLSADADARAVREAASAAGYPILEWRSPEAALGLALAAPALRGVLGFLSVGFLATIGLTLISAVTQMSASFRAQASQLGVLRALGMAAWKTMAYLLLVQAGVALSAVLGGTVIGVITTLLYLPLLDFSGGLPPYLIRVGWNDIALIYSLFALVFFGVTWAMTVALGRENLSTLVKMGDA